MPVVPVIVDDNDIDQQLANYLKLDRQSFVSFSNYIGIENAYMIAAFVGKHYNECNGFIKSMIATIQKFYNGHNSKYKFPLSIKQKTKLIDAVRDHIKKHRVNVYQSTNKGVDLIKRRIIKPTLIEKVVPNFDKPLFLEDNIQGLTKL